MDHILKTNLKGLKKWAWKKNLDGFFSLNEKSIVDTQVRKIVDWGILNGYTYDADILEEKVVELLKMN